ncbi:hypothetical protein [Streptomyces sp. NPDC101150]
MAAAPPGVGAGTLPGVGAVAKNLNAGKSGAGAPALRRERVSVK